ncbi:MAG: hypothetical protein IKU84_05665 [Clostridia bacterium]|nr:hypothetical protein [Clostridia bacterium]
MRILKKTMVILCVALLATMLFACEGEGIQVIDGPGMQYCDADYRTEYANIFDFDNYEGQPYFAVAFLGYGDRMDFRNSYVAETFKNLDDEKIEKIEHMVYEGDEWYLIVPRYKNPVYITDLNTDDTYTIHNGEAFTVNCNLSDLHSNIEIYTEDGFGAYKFSPQMGGDGHLITNTDIHDITDYTGKE